MRKPWGRGITPSAHRRMLEFFNAAAGPADLTRAPRGLLDAAAPDRTRRDAEGRRILFDEPVAKAILEVRDRFGPFGFTHVDQLGEIQGVADNDIDELIDVFGSNAMGEWRPLPYGTQRPGPMSVDVAHAALLHTGKVLFIPADYNSVGWPTPIWDPSDLDHPVFQYPATNPDYALFCGGHSFLSDGRLLVLGGGGDRTVTPEACWGFIFDPIALTWTRTSGDMNSYRWYPTAVTLGDHRVLVTCGNGAGEIEAYVERTDRFEDVSGDTQGFPHLYPGLHLLPDHRIFYSRTGWGSSGQGNVGAHDSSGYFEFDAPPARSVNGEWIGIVPSFVHRAKGMSVTLLEPERNRVRVLVVGGPVDESTYELIDVTNLSPASEWSPPAPMPDGQGRRQCNAVLLPDGTVFLSGGLSAQFSPSALFDPAQDTWSQMAPLPSGRVRQYHSFALLLPDATVLSAGGDGHPDMEVFTPPYLFKGQRPVIRACPTEALYGTQFNVQTPDEPHITSVVLVRPMAVTHQLDTEQRVIRLPFVRNPATNELVVTAPSAEYPHSLAPPGYYMLFVLNSRGIPSVASWIRLLSPVTLVVRDRTPIAALTRNEDHMDLWLVDAYGVVRGNYWNGDWHEWYALPNPAATFPERGHVAVVSRNDDHMEIFAVGNDGNLHHNWWNGEWRGWRSLGAPNIPGLPPGAHALVPGSPLTGQSRFTDHMEVWIVAADGQLHSIWWDGNSWRGWNALPGAVFPPGAPLTSHCRNDDHMEVWGIDAAGVLRGIWWNGNWRDWYALPTPGDFGLRPGGHLTVAGRHDDHMELWTIGTDDRLHGIWWNGGWEPWYTLAGPFSFPPGGPLAATSRNDDFMEVWAVGDDQTLHGVWWNGDWKPWYSLDPLVVPRGTPVAALSRQDDHMEVWCVAPTHPAQTICKVHGTYWDGNWNGFFRLE